MKTLIAGLLLLTSMSSFANLNLDQIQGNNCKVIDLDTDTTIVDREVLSKNSSSPVYASDENGNTIVSMYIDELYRVGDYIYSIYVSSFPYTEDLSIRLMKERITQDGNRSTEYVISAEHKKNIEISDIADSVEISCNK